MSWKMTMFFCFCFLRTPHIGEAGRQRNTSEGKRREEKGNGRIHLYHGVLWSLCLIFSVSVVQILYPISHTALPEMYWFVVHRIKLKLAINQTTLSHHQGKVMHFFCQWNKVFCISGITKEIIQMQTRSWKMYLGLSSFWVWMSVFRMYCKDSSCTG